MQKFTFLLLLWLTSLKISYSQAQLTEQIGHNQFVTCTAFNSDNSLVVSGSADNTVKLWDLNSGRLLRTFQGHTNAVHAVVFSPDGTKIFSASLDKTVKMWDIKTGDLLRTFTDSPNGLTCIAITPNGNIVAAAGWDKMIRLWNVQTGDLMGLFAEHTDKVRAIRFNHNGKLLLSASDDNTVKIWNTTNGICMKTLEGHKDNVTTIAMNPDGKTLASVSDDKTLKIWDLSSLQVVSTLKFAQNLDLNPQKLNSLVYTPDSKQIISIADNFIVFWDSSKGIINQRIKTTYSPTALSISANGKYIAVANLKSIDIYEVATQKIVKTLCGFSSIISSVDMSRNMQFIACGNRDNTVQIWKTALGKRQSVLTGHSDFVEAVQFSPDNQSLASSSRDNSILIWNLLQTNSKPIAIKGHTDAVTCIDFRIDGKYLVSGSSDKTVRLWEAATGKPMRIFNGHDAMIHSVGLSSDGKYAASGSWDKTIKIWDIDKNQLAKTFVGHTGDVFSIRFSPDNQTLVSGSEDKTLRLWDVESGRTLKTFVGHTDYVKCVAFSADGKIIASGSFDKTIRLWNAQTGECIGVLKGHKSYVRSISFSSNGKYLVSGGSDSQMKIWDLSQQKELLNVITFSNGIDYVVTTPSGYFDGTENGIRQALHYVDGLTIIPLESLYEKYYVPNLWSQIMSGVKFKDETQKLKLPPLVKIISPTNSNSPQKETVTVKIQVTDMGGGIDEIRLYHNAKLVETAQRGFKPIAQKGEVREQTFDIVLVKGINVIKATAFNKDRTESQADSVLIYWKQEEQRAEANLYILNIGINKYKNESYTLNYAKDDAKAFTEAIQKGGAGIFKSIKVFSLSDEKAVKSEILKQFALIQQQAQAQDVFVFYYAGHGVMSGDSTAKQDFYLVPHDITQLYGNDDALNEKAISSTSLMEMSKKVKAQKQLIILDACQSGAAVDMLAQRGVAEQKAIVQLARSAGIAIMAASGSKQYASEVKELGHGVFTYALLEGLSGKADGGSKDGKITINELRTYLEDRVPELTTKHRGQAQYPTAYTKGQDFPIVIGK